MPPTPLRQFPQPVSQRPSQRQSHRQLRRRQTSFTQSTQSTQSTIHSPPDWFTELFADFPDVQPTKIGQYRLPYIPLPYIPFLYQPNVFQKEYDTRERVHQYEKAKAQIELMLSPRDAAFINTQMLRLKTHLSALLKKLHDTDGKIVFGVNEFNDVWRTICSFKRLVNDESQNGRVFRNSIQYLYLQDCVLLFFRLCQTGRFRPPERDRQERQRNQKQLRQFLSALATTSRTSLTTQQPDITTLITYARQLNNR